MNKWFYRAAGTVGVAAGGFLLLGGGAAQAEDAHATPATDPLDLRGLLDDFFSPTGGGGDMSQVALGPGAQGKTPDMLMKGQLSNLRDVSPTRDLGFVGEAPSSPTAAINPAMLGSGEAVGTEKPALISDLPMTGTFTKTVGADRAVDALGVAGTSQGLLSGGNGLSADASKLQGLVPATSDVDTSRAGAALPAALGIMPADAIPAVPTAKAVDGKANGFTRNTAKQGQDMVPALIGDAMVAQSPELFTQPESLPPVATLPFVGDLELKGVPGASDGASDSPLGLLGSLGSLGLPGLSGNGATTLPAPAGDDADQPTADKPSPTRRHHSSASERPVAGEDADFAETASVGLPLIGDLSNLTSVLPTGGSFAGMPGMKHMDV